jgi:group I intron endonuclease
MIFYHGIYKITNTVTGRVYIGRSNDPGGRLEMHRHELGRNNHCNPFLQREWNEYGEACFTFEVVETVEKALIQEVELKWIKKHSGNCYNRVGVRPTGNQYQKVKE